MEFLQNFQLQNFNTFALQVKAKYFASVSNIAELKQALAFATKHELPRLILGGGSNMLLQNDFPGLVIYLHFKGLELAEQTKGEICIKAACGENWHEFVQYCLRHQYFGLENLSLIPGNVGAAPIQNIGAYGVELKDSFQHLQAIDVQSGEIKTFDQQQCEFSYRNSVFKGRLKDRYIILSVTLRLSKTAQSTIEYGTIKQELERMACTAATPLDVSQAVINIRQAKLVNPKVLGNAGSFFKNPVVDKKTYQTLFKRFPQLVAYPERANRIKLAAAWLIEQAGWKSKRQGQVGVYSKQSLVIVNYGGASGDEILSFSKQIQASVEHLFGVTLETEVQIY